MGESTCGAALVAAPAYDGGKALFEIAELGRIALERATTARYGFFLLLLLGLPPVVCHTCSPLRVGVRILVYVCV